jgi:hypothetical protein
MIRTSPPVRDDSTVEQRDAGVPGDRRCGCARRISILCGCERLSTDGQEESERREDDRAGARDSRSATCHHLAGVTSGAACEGGCRSIVAIHLGMVLKFACRSWGVSPAYQSRLGGSLK